MTDEERKAADEAVKAATDAKAAADASKTYDQAYVTRLKNEAAEARTSADALVKERDELKSFKSGIEKKELEAKGEYEKASAKLEADLAAERKGREADNAARDQRFILGEARTTASKLGIIDGLEEKVAALVDLSDLKIASDGAISGLQERIEKLKTDNPHWFKTGTGAGGRAGASPGGGPAGAGKGVDFATLDDAQLDAKLKEILAT